MVGVSMTFLPGFDLFLAFRTPESRTAVLVESPDDAAATDGLAFLAFAVVDLERMLEITEFAGGLAMIPQRRAAGLDRLAQHRVNGGDEALGMVRGFTLPCGQRRGQPPRRQMRAEQRLADVDIAEAGDHALVEQRRLQAGLLVGASLRQHFGVEFVAERFGAKPHEQRLLVERLARDDLHVAEAARVVEHHRCTRRHVKHHMIMRSVLTAGMMELARRRLFIVLDDAKRARHPQTVSYTHLTLPT